MESIPLYFDGCIESYWLTDAFPRHMSCNHYRWQLWEATTLLGPYVTIFCGSLQSRPGPLEKVTFWIMTPNASPLCCLPPIWSLSFWLFFHSPGRWLDWTRKRTWCTWRCGRQMDVSAVATRPGPGRSACSSLSPPPICILMAWEDEQSWAPLLPYPSLFPRVGERPTVPGETFHWNKPSGMNFSGDVS